MPGIDGGHLIAKSLKRNGVEQIFTLCGRHIMGIYEGCRDEGIRIIDFRHEQAAAFAAEGWSKVTGTPGVCIATAGPGVTNTVTPVANAFRNSTPLVVIGGRHEICEQDLGAAQELNHLEYMQPITKWARRILQTERIPDYINQAFRQAAAPAFGPVFLEVPLDVIENRTEETELHFGPCDNIWRNKRCDPALIEQAAVLISQSQRPVILAGSSIWWCGAAQELRKLAEHIGSPVYLNSMGRGSLPPFHPLIFTGSRRFALSESDLVLVAGAPLDFRLGYGRPPGFNPAAAVIQIDIAEEELGKNRSIDLGICADIKPVLRQLYECLTTSYYTSDSQVKPFRLEWLGRIREKEEIQHKIELPELFSDAVPVHAARLCKEIQDFIDQDTVIIVDGGEIGKHAGHILKVHRPGYWLDPGPMGTLGIGTGYGIACKLARPQTKVIIIHGDGSFGLNPMEFDTMVRHNIKVVSVVANDGFWGQVKNLQNSVYGRSLGAALSQQTRYDKLVESLGGYGELVERPQDIRPALQRAFDSEKPACINVITS